MGKDRTRNAEATRRAMDRLCSQASVILKQRNQDKNGSITVITASACVLPRKEVEHSEAKN